MARLLLLLVSAVVEGLLTALEAVLWACWSLLQLATWLVHALQGRQRVLPDTEGLALVCPQGHEVPTEGGLYQCSRCFYTYEGSMLVCENPECRASTAFIDCPTCGLSVRNPYRWGKK